MKTPTLLLTLLPILAVAAPAQEGNVAVRAGRLLTPDGVIENGTLVIRGGVIEAVGGPDLEVPFDVLLHEFPEATVFCGFAEAHSSLGLDRANENVAVAPFLDVKDSIDPSSFYFEDELRGGTVAIGVIPGNSCVIGGRGRVLSPAGMTVEAMTLDDAMGMKMAIGPKRGWSRSAQLAELREATDRLDHALEALGRKLLDDGELRKDRERALEELEDEEDDGDRWDSLGGFVRYGPDFPGKALIAEEDLDDAQRGLVDILNGDERIWLWCPGPSDIYHGKSWAEEHELVENVVFVVRSGAWKAAEMIAETGRPVVLIDGPWHVETDPLTHEEVRTFAPLKFHEAGVAFALGSQKGRMGPDRLSWQAATCVREGVPPGVALASVTTVPARLWGLEDRVSRLAEGADGSFVVLSGDPLDFNSQVLEVWVRGDQVYDREGDERLQRLLEGKQE